MANSKGLSFETLGCSSVRGLLIWIGCVCMLWLFGTLVEDTIYLQQSSYTQTFSKGFQVEVELDEAIPAGRKKVSSKQNIETKIRELKEEGLPLITLFTTLMNKNDAEKQQIQNNTVRMYEWLKPWVEGIVFTEFENIQRSVHSIGVEARIPHLNKFNLPILRHMFIEVEKRPSFFYGYHNGDILFNHELIDTLRAVKGFIKEGVLKKNTHMIGVRSNYDYRIDKDFIEDPVTQDPKHLEEHLRKYHDNIKRMGREGKPFQTNAEDYFIYTRGWVDWEDEIPDYVIGRPAYDNALVRWANLKAMKGQCDVIDVSDTVIAVHQTGKDGNYAGHTHTRLKEDKEWNNVRANHKFDYGETTAAAWRTRRDMKGRIEILKNHQLRGIWDHDTNTVYIPKRLRLLVEDVKENMS